MPHEYHPCHPPKRLKDVLPLTAPKDTEPEYTQVPFDVVSVHVYRVLFFGQKEPRLHSLDEMHAAHRMPGCALF